MNHTTWFWAFGGEPNQGNSCQCESHTSCREGEEQQDVLLDVAAGLKLPSRKCNFTTREGGGGGITHLASLMARNILALHPRYISSSVPGLLKWVSFGHTLPSQLCILPACRTVVAMSIMCNVQCVMCNVQCAE